MELTKDIKEILENVVYWETCPKDYKDKINAYLKSENESEALSIHTVSQCDEKICWWRDRNSKYDECDHCIGECNWHGG